MHTFSGDEMERRCFFGSTGVGSSSSSQRRFFDEPA